jgi:hypothetical protein
MTPSRPRLQYLLPKINTMASCPSRIHHQLISFFVSNPRHHALPNASTFIHGKALLPNDDVLPTADASTKWFEENLLSNGVLPPNSAHMSVSSLYQFLVLTPGRQDTAAPAAARLPDHRQHDPRTDVRTTTEQEAPTPLPSKPLLDGHMTLLTVNSCIKVRLDLQADKSPVVVKGPFFPRVVNPRYRIHGKYV